jgi:RNA recognition motif-containing protein
MEPSKKIKLTGDGLEKLPNGMPIPSTLPPEQMNIRKPGKSEDSKRHRKIYRKAGEEEWVDKTLEDWDENDFRIFVGNLGYEVSEEGLRNAFKKYTSVSKVKLIVDKKSQRNKGYGFVSFLSSDECLKAFREMNGKHIGSQPITIKKSEWKKKAVFKN